MKRIFQKAVFHFNQIIGQATILEELFCGLLGLFSSLGLLGELYLLTGKDIIMSSLVTIVVTVAFYKFYKIEIQHQRTIGYLIFNLFIAFLFALMLCVGARLESSLEKISVIIFASVVIGMTVVFYLPITYLTDYFDHKSLVDNSEKTNANYRTLKISFIIICLSWLFCYLALFPGVYAIDAPTWYLEFSDVSRQISSRWSPVIAGFFYLCIRVGEILFHSKEAGMALYSAMQMGTSLIVIWNVLQFLYTHVSAGWCMAATVFYTIIPTHVILSVSSAQDAWFASCFTVCILQFVKMGGQSENYVVSTSSALKLYLSMILMCVCRNNGLHSCLVLIVIMLFICRNKRLWVIVLAVVLSVIIYQGPLMKTFNIDTSTTIREMISLPLQQMAYAYKNKANDLSDADRQAMQEYAPEWNWENDLTGISDTIKSGIDTNKIMENPEKFFRMYITIGHKAPKDYIFGTLYQTIGLWYPEKHYSDPQIWHPYLNVQSYDINKLDFWKSSADIRQISLFPQYLDVIKYLFGWDNEATGYGGNLQMGFSNIPIFSLFCKMGIYFWMVIYLFFYAIYRKRNYAFMPLGLAIGLTITIILSPVMYYRYYAPIIFSTPILIQSVIVKRQD